MHDDQLSRDALSPRAFGASFRTFLEQAATGIPVENSVFSERLEAHLGVEPSGLEVVTNTFSILFAQRTRDFALLRYMVNGTVDASFGQNGTVVTNMGSGSSYDTLKGIFRLSDGKIVAVGDSFAVSRVGIAAIAGSASSRSIFSSISRITWRENGPRCR